MGRKTRRGWMWLATFASGLGAISACVSDSSDTNVFVNDGGAAEDVVSGGDSSVTPGTDGSMSSDANGAGTDSGGSDAGGQMQTDASDAGTDAGPYLGPACTLSKPFGAPVALADVNTTQQETMARISPDGLELFVTYQLTGGGTQSTRRFTRTSWSGAWTLADTAGALYTMADGGSTSASGLTLTPDGVTGYIGAYPLPVNGNQRITFTTRTAPGATTWTNLVQVDALAVVGSATNEMAFLNYAGNRIYFMSGGGGPPFEVYYADRTGTTTFSTPAQAFAAPPAESRYPVVTANDLTMYIGQYGMLDGGAYFMNIYVATRASTGMGFGAPANVTELNSAAFAAPSWVSPNGCMILFFSNRVSANSYDIYQAVKPL